MAITVALSCTYLFPGDIISYHISLLLGMDNLPVVTLVRYNATSPQWQAVVPALSEANWTDGQIVPCCKWIDKVDHDR